MRKVAFLLECNARIAKRTNARQNQEELDRSYTESTIFKDVRWKVVEFVTKTREKMRNSTKRRLIYRCFYSS